MMLDGQGRPIVAWGAWRAGEGAGNRVYLKRWTGAAWAPIGADVFLGAGGHPALALDRSGAPLVARDFRGEIIVSRLKPWSPSPGVR